MLYHMPPRGDLIVTGANTKFGKAGALRKGVLNWGRRKKVMAWYIGLVKKLVWVLVSAYDKPQRIFGQPGNTHPWYAFLAFYGFLWFNSSAVSV